MKTYRPLLRSIALCLAGFSGLACATPPSCPPPGWNQTQLTALRQQKFALADDDARQRLALGLAACLASPNPVLRDEVAFEALATWLRANQLHAATRDALLAQLLPLLDASHADGAGFLQPFAALTLSELARVDRITPYLDTATRQTLVDRAATYLENQRDYRGFDERQGWRHGIAHGADLAMQLTLDPALDKAQLDRLLAAVRSQVAPKGVHFYIYGEPERLARPVVFALQRGLHGKEEWQAWLQALLSPAPMADWDQAFQSQAGLAKRHNTRAFLLALYAQLRDHPQLSALAEPVRAALAKLP